MFPWSYKWDINKRRTNKKRPEGTHGWYSEDRMLWLSSGISSGFRCACNTTSCQYIHRCEPAPLLWIWQTNTYTHTHTYTHTLTVISFDLISVRQRLPPLSLKTSLLTPIHRAGGATQSVTHTHTHTHTYMQEARAHGYIYTRCRIETYTHYSLISQTFAIMLLDPFLII